MQLRFNIKGMDFSRAGEAASRLKQTLQMIGMEYDTIRQALIVTYEAELNIVIHAYRGILTADISPHSIIIEARDEGPGIPDISLAMQEGYSTAPPHIREMGFGAGMGLPNIKKFSDELKIDSTVNKGTRLKAIIYTQKANKQKSGGN